jgi:hypothetical protein
MPVQLTDIAISRIQAALLSLATSIATINNITSSLDGLPAAIQDVFDKTDAAITDTVCKGSSIHVCRRPAACPKATSCLILTACCFVPACLQFNNMTLTADAVSQAEVAEGQTALDLFTQTLAVQLQNNLLAQSIQQVQVSPRVAGHTVLITARTGGAACVVRLRQTGRLWSLQTCLLQSLHPLPTSQCNRFKP